MPHALKLPLVSSPSEKFYNKTQQGRGAGRSVLLQHVDGCSSQQDAEQCAGVAIYWGESRVSENIHIGFFHSHGAEVAAAALQTLKSSAESSIPALILRIHSSYSKNNFLHYLLTRYNNRFEVPNKNRPLNLLNRLSNLE